MGHIAFFQILQKVLRAGVLIAAFSHSAFAGQSVSVHGLWVWKGPSVMEAPRGAEMLRDFCKSEDINEVYLSISSHGETMAEAQLTHLIELLHRSNIRVEALISSEDADEPGKHRDKLLGHVREIVQFNRSHAGDRFDGIHLDIEPQQRPENKGAGNLRFLPGLVDAYRAVRELAESARLTVNADIQNKLLKGTLGERRMLLSSLPRITLMLYELSSPNDGENVGQQTEKLRTASQKFLDMAYDGLHDANLAKMDIGLRAPDYGAQLPRMLQALDEANRGNPHYEGWARHSYNDALQVALNAGQTKPFLIPPARQVSIYDRQPGVLINVGGKRRSRGYHDVLAVLDESDGSEQNRQRHCGSRFAISLSALRAPNSHVIAAHLQVLYLDADLTGFPHHPSALRFRNRCDSVGPFRDDDRISHLQVVIKLKLYGVSDVRGLRV